MPKQPILRSEKLSINFSKILAVWQAEYGVNS